jgi:hypothetical protein
LFKKVTSFLWTYLRPEDAPEDTKRSITLKNGSRIISRPSNVHTIRGYSGPDLIVVDEAAQVLDEMYYTVRPMLAVSGGGIWLLSTPHGKRGFFYEEWTNGKGWDRIQVTADECPRISDEFLEEERASLGEIWFRQEYYCEFMDTVEQIFETEFIEDAFDDETETLFEEDELEGILSGA